MKILALRGKNLASLSQGFEVDFTQPPLVDAGIFAITGSTGAGKSTLLDALCLALYNDTPRLLKASSRDAPLPDVAGEALPPRDVRSLLRRGTAEGFAEVDFIGNDQQVYRARWSVRRARNKAAGKLQQVDMSLLRLPDEKPIGGRLKKEVLPAIRERVGLSFEQFTRAVLLAQHEFAAFLKAPDDERASLLETLTGTERFAELSQQAYIRAKQEREQVTQLENRLQQQLPLDAEARQQQELTREQAAAQTAQLEQQQAELEQQLQWHANRERLQAARDEAEQHQQQIQAEQNQAKGRQQYLQHVLAAQPARTLLQNKASLQAEQQSTQQQVNKLQQAWQALEQNLRVAQTQLQTAQQQQLQAQQAQTDTLPLLHQARLLDARLEDLSTALHTVNAQRARLQQEQQTLMKQQTQLQQAQSLLQQQWQAGQDWLGAHSHWRLLGESWPQWQVLLEQANQLAQTLDDLHSQQQQQKATQLQQEHDCLNLERELERLSDAMTAAHKALDAAKKTLAGFDLEHLAQEKQQWEEKKQALLTAQQLKDNVRQVTKHHKVLQARHDRLLNEQSTCQQCLDDVRDELPLQAARLEQASKSLAQAELACRDNVEALRAALQQGEPCPVCGALEHPYMAEMQPIGDVLLATLLNEHQQQQQAWEKLKTQETEYLTRLETLQSHSQEVEQERQGLAQEQEQHEQAWSAHAALHFVAEAEDALEDQLEQVQQVLNEQVQLETASRLAQQARDRAQSKLDSCQQEQLRSHADFQEAKQQLTLSRQAVHSLEERFQQEEQRLHALLESLQAPLVVQAEDWRVQWQQDTAGFLALQQSQALDWQRQQQTMLQQQQALQALQAELKYAQDKIQRNEDDVRQAVQQQQALQTDYQAHYSERQNLLNGEAADAVEQRLQQALQTSAAHLAECQQQLKFIQLQQQDVAAELKSVTYALDKCNSAYQTAKQSLQDWLLAWNQNQRHETHLDEAQLQALLAHKADWLQQEQQWQQHLKQALDKAHIVLQERERQLSCHLALQPADTMTRLDALQQEQQNLLQALQVSRETWQQAVLTLKQDDACRAAAESLLASLEQQQAKLRVWDQLDDLIGSASGKKFRNFAQQYSLDILVAHANRHLADLSRRYILQRIPDSLALLVRDLDMGSEVRSVHSLSGGESFLVSLALALGLASLSSSRVQVESLFIDEGFGSLDADSLRVAMDALDKLQAQGRKVGVISHVQEMTERIGVQIQVKRSAGGQSKLIIISSTSSFY